MASTEDLKAIHRWSVPGIGSGASTEIEALPGRVSLFLGANGAGKSALGYWLRTQVPGTIVVHLRANRQLWFGSAGPTSAPAQRASLAQNQMNLDGYPDSRWIDRSASSSIELALLDLVIATHRRDQHLSELVDSEGSIEAVRAKSSERPVDALNRVFRSAGFGLSFCLEPDSNFSVVKDGNPTSYPIFQMSDGEKGALLLAAKVLTAPEGAVVILDEPERHLHRSISASLIEAIVTERGDCHVVLLTHDLDLASSLRRDLTTPFVVSGCRVSQSGTGEAWELNAVEGSDPLPKKVRRAILGGRKQILFVEGDAQSIDTRLYSALYPEWQIQPSGGCEEVGRCVKGLRDSADHHWIEARGLLDRDGRSDDEVRVPRSDSIQIIPVSEIESLLYLETVISKVAKIQETNRGTAMGEMLPIAKRAAIQSLTVQSRDHLAASVAEKRLARSIATAVPTREALKTETSPLQISVVHDYAELRQGLDRLIASEQFDEIVCQFPIRDSGFRKAIATSLGFPDFVGYEAVALNVVRTEMRDEIRQLIEQCSKPDAPKDQSSLDQRTETTVSIEL
jgi:AAA domain, putative AbiEii toxin, Type IV TA system